MVHSTVPNISYWSEYLFDLGTDQETVAEYRKRLNIVDEPPQFTRFNADSFTPVWESLTQWEKLAESLFTPKGFEYVEQIHGPPKIDETYYSYNYFESCDIDYPDLTFVEKEWTIDINRQLELARLCLPTQPIHNVFHFFFG